MHSPTITASKYWPGDLGIVANYSAVYAKLMINGKSHGVHPFLVQLRDLNTHEPLKGRQMGDIGPKIGYNSKDNGYLILDQVRIPRSNMLDRYASVDRQGNF